jgi:hypothetical protein
VGAVEEPSIEILLQLANLEGHGRLSHVECFRRLGKTQQACNGVKDLKPPVRHISIPGKNTSDKYYLYHTILLKRHRFLRPLKDQTGHSYRGFSTSRSTPDSQLKGKSNAV